MGIETEFGCLVADDGLGSPESVVELIKDQVFYEQRLGAIDLHARDEVFEPAQSGGFLLNGGRLYIDAVGSHLEYATAECRSLKDLVAQDRAGHRIIVRAINELGLSDTVSVYNNSVDHFGGHTFGCHENYLARIDESFFSHKVQQLYPFLVTRQIFAGVGRVGGHILTNSLARPSYQDVMANPVDYVWVSQVYGVHPDDSVHFQLSQRADHILKTIASRVRFNRALINPKWEHFYSHDHMQRLHILFGESNQSEYAYALKVGTTLLALQLIEDELVDDAYALAAPLYSLRDISRDQEYCWECPMADGTMTKATDIQRHYLHLAERYAGLSDDVDWTLREWSAILDALDEDPPMLHSKLDWAAKLRVVRQYMEEEKVGWEDDALHSVDLEYHNIDPDKSLFYALKQMGEVESFVSELDVVEAMATPPQNTRALARSRLVERALKNRNSRFYLFDWNGVALDRNTYFDLSDPYSTN